MSMTKKSIVTFRPDLIPNLPELIWSEIEGYGNHEWDLPEKPELLEAIVGDAAATEIYSITDHAECNVRLRQILSPYLKSNDMAVRLAAIEWVVYDWGNVRGKSEKHESWPKKLEKFEPDVIKQFISANYKDRIASWSKVLGFADSSTYAIYDARVAMALNAILDKTNYENRFYMPPPSSQKLGGLFSHIKEVVGRIYLGRQVRYLGYFDYMDLLNAMVAKGLSPNILEVEMRLFAHGMTFAKEYAVKHNLPYEE
jgi:hypothetical protein